MNYRTLQARRRCAGLLGTLAICLAIAFAVDGMIAGGRKDPKLHHLLPGESLNLTDPMPRGTERLDQLSLRSSSPDVSLRMVETFTGFWLGGTLWRAEATVPATAAPGEHSVIMYYQSNGTETTPRQAYRIRIHQTAKDIQAASLSLSSRTFGVSPYLVAAVLMLLAFLPIFSMLAMARPIVQALRDEGMSEIFRAMASPEGQRIFFSLPSTKPLAANTLVEVLDDRAEKVLGKALVFAVVKGDVEAIMQDEVKIRPGSLARPILP